MKQKSFSGFVHLSLSVLDLIYRNTQQGLVKWMKGNSFYYVCLCIKRSKRYLLMEYVGIEIDEYGLGIIKHFNISILIHLFNVFLNHLLWDTLQWQQSSQWRTSQTWSLLLWNTSFKVKVFNIYNEETMDVANYVI